MCSEAVTPAARGAEGERRVAEYLRRRGYTVIKRNYSDRFGEIDIIAENAAYLVFVEVKTREQGAVVSGFEAVDSAKQRRLRKTGIMFSKRLRNSLPLRFDVAEVTVEVSGDGPERWHLKYLENAF